MRYKEFNLTEDELFELNMSPTNLAKMVKGIDARVGMEFELIVPNVDNPDEDEYESEPDYDANESFPTGPGWTRDVIDFFRGGDMGNSRALIQRQIDELNENFYAWVDEDQEEFINSVEGQDRITEIAGSNVDRSDYDTDEEYVAAIQAYIDENEDYIRDELIDEYNDNLDSKFEEWLDDQGINTMADFANEYDLEWPYWTQPDYNSGGGASIDAVADDFSQAIGRPVNAASSYHGATRRPGHYVVEPDGSLQGDQGETGLEFVSPVLTVDEMLSDIDKVVAWAERAGAYTNSSTGLHMNVSVPNQKNLDYVKLAMFLGDNYILEQFGREGNTYCKSALKKIVTMGRGDPSRVEEMMRQFQGGLSELASKILHTGSTEKFTSINNRDQWVEFRGPGGDWMTGDAGITTVKNTLLRAVAALSVATKPEEFKQEYYKKLYKTLTQGREDDTIQYFAKYAAGELPQSALKAFVRNIQGKRKANKLALGAKDILLVWKVIGSQNSPYQSQGVEVVAMDELGAYKEAIKKWSLNLGGNSIEDYTQQNGWRAQPVRAATSNDMNMASNKFYRVAVGGRPDRKVYVRAMSEYQAKTLAVQRHADVFANVTFDDMVAIHDPDYQGEETAVAAMRARSGEPIPAGAVGGEQSTDANYEIYNTETNRSMFRFIANTDPEAERKYQDWLSGSNSSPELFKWRRIENRGIPGSTAELQRQRTTQTPSRDQEFTGHWEVVSRNTNEVVSVISGIGNAVADAERHAARWQQQTGFSDPIYVRPLMRPRDNLSRNQGEVQQRFTVDYTIRQYGDIMNNRVTVPAANADAAMANVRNQLEASRAEVLRIEADPVEQAPARGTESLPPGNTRWLVLDQNDREVYSFVHRSNQGEANQYAANWLRGNNMVGQGEFTVVPAR
jgi:hypothetical protein